jgi:hypothetical protein
MKSIIKKFSEIFDGFELAYGQHGNFQSSESGKVNGKAQTISNSLSEEIIKSHLDGSGNSLGVVPLKLNNKLKFGAIDIDIKHPTNPLKHTIQEIEEKINKLNLPLVVCQSKSNGIHLYCFTQEEVDAKILVDKLKEWASLIGYGNCEIFPKQTSRIDQKDIGNWINLPYFDYKKTNRYAINKGRQLSIDEFFELVEISRIPTKELQDFKVEILDETFNDAPPCIQILSSLGVEEGSRNNGLYDFAVYFRNKYPDNYEDKIMEANYKYFKPSLSKKEVESIIKAMRKKDFFFRCNEYPIVQYCNKTECRKRKFGIGSCSVGSELNLDNLTKYISSDNSVRWYASYQGNRIQLSTAELINQRVLILKMLDATNTIFAPVKQPEWMQKIEILLKNCEIYHDPIDASPKGQFKELLDSFLTANVHAEKKSDLAKYSIYFDKKNKEMYFQSITLFQYLKNKRFYFAENEIWHWLKEFGGRAEQASVSGKKIRVWIVQAPDFFVEDEDVL